MNPNPTVRLEDRLYIVGIPAGDVAAEAARMQRLLAEAYSLYTGTPPSLHLTLAVAASRSPDEAARVSRATSSAAHGQPPVEIRVSCYTCIPLPHSSFAMEVDSTPSLTAFVRRLYHHLTADSVQLLSTPDRWTFHITLVSRLFSTNPLPPESYCRLCRRVRRPLANLTGAISRVEVWRPRLEDMVVASFPLQGPSSQRCTAGTWKKPG